MKNKTQLSERKIYRHKSGEGSVIEFDMYGTPVKLFVADAKYRTNKIWGLQGTDTPLENFMDDYLYISPKNTGDERDSPLFYQLSDAELQNKFPSFIEDKTAKYNTDVLMEYSQASAAHWCREQNIDGIGRLDLPNLYELMVIYLESDRLDTLDPTCEMFPTMKLGCSAPRGRFFNTSALCWSSTEATAKGARLVNCHGYVGYGSKNYDSLGVIPVKEL